MLKPPAEWYPQRGEVYLLRLNKNRPSIIISTDGLNRHALDVCIVPVTSVHHGRFSLRVAIQDGEGGLRRDSWAKCDQVTTVDKQLVEYPPLGRVTTSTLRRIEAGIRFALELT